MAPKGGKLMALQWLAHGRATEPGKQRANQFREWEMEERWQGFSTEAGDRRAVQTSAGISLGTGSNRPLATGAFRCEPFTSQNFQSDQQEPGEKLSLKKIHSIQNQAFLAQQTDRFSSCKKIIPPKQVLHGVKGHFAVQAVGLERNWGRLGLYYCRTHASTEKGQNSTVMFKPPTILLPTP
ncbi:hypothetical protein Anapl_01146 [Anas platyrhynchos]|uniref:Uncharacterized protein n=1 Tax=Anas platyrhynchos TaxID=8839 RepID=R0LVL7_ANAPL|nr:hypothetical protein Anapl_01146 [Anas platyrhynchos]